MGRQIIRTGGQGLVASDALKASLGALAVAIIVLLIFFFLNGARKSAAQPTSSLTTPVVAWAG